MVAPVDNFDPKILPKNIAGRISEAAIGWGSRGPHISQPLWSNGKTKALDVGGLSSIDFILERVYCKRPIQCLSSSKILTTHPLTARRVCTPPPLPPLVRGEDTLAGWRGGGGLIFWKMPDTALYSTYVSTLWIYIFLEVE
jgi:hypothetical protein